MASNTVTKNEHLLQGDASSSTTPSTIMRDTEIETSKADNAVVITPVQDVEKAAGTKPIPPKEAYTVFSPSRQLLIVLIATLAGFFAPLCGAVYLPSLILFQDIFHATSSVINATVSVYMAVFAVTPLFGAAASDYGGRKSVYIVSLAIFIIANTLLAVIPPTIGGLFTLRVFQAFGSSVVTSIGAGTVADVTEPSRRASRMGLFLLGPQLGPVLGPLIGGQFSDPGHWRWIFGFLSIACLPIYLMILFFLPETLRCIVGNGSYFTTDLKDGIRAWLVMPRLRQKQVVEEGKYPKPPRPTPKSLFTLLFFVPNLIVSFGSALQFSGLYCIYVVFPRVWQQNYHWSGSETGYAYLVPGITLLISSLIVGRISDLRYRKFKANHDGQAPPPERRIDIQIWGYLIAAVGKIMFGWFVLNELHPAAALAASGIAAVGTGLVMVTSTAYQTECQPSAAASLVALSGLLRNLGSAISAAIIGKLLEAMGYGWCFTGLAILDVVWIGALFFIRLRGHIYRERLTKATKASGK